MLLTCPLPPRQICEIICPHKELAVATRNSLDALEYILYISPIRFKWQRRDQLLQTYHGCKIAEGQKGTELYFNVHPEEWPYSANKTLHKTYIIIRKAHINVYKTHFHIFLVLNISLKESYKIKLGVHKHKRFSRK